MQTPAPESVEPPPAPIAHLSRGPTEAQEEWTGRERSRSPRRELNPADVPAAEPGPATPILRRQSEHDGMSDAKRAGATGSPLAIRTHVLHTINSKPSQKILIAHAGRDKGMDIRPPSNRGVLNPRRRAYLTNIQNERCRNIVCVAMHQRYSAARSDARGNVSLSKRANICC